MLNNGSRWLFVAFLKSLPHSSLSLYTAAFLRGGDFYLIIGNLTMHVDNAKKSYFILFFLLEENLRYTKLTRIFQKLGLHTSN